MIIEKLQLIRERPDVTLTTYIHEPSPEMLPGQLRPAVLVCPGGGYFSCSDREAEPVALAFAAMGYQAYVLHYSTYLEGKGGIPSFEEPIRPKEDRIFPIPFIEIGLAMQVIRDHEQKWATDPARLILCGFSAGAHNCGMYATRWADSVVTDRLGGIENVVPPAGAILCYTISDYVLMKEKGRDSEFSRTFFDRANIAYFGCSEPDDEMLIEASPARHVNDNTPPMFLWATADDALVPSDNSILMAKALSDQKIPFEFHLFESGHHGLCLANQASAGNKGEINSDVAKWLPLCEAWLLRRFPLQLPDAPILPV